jgi:hypothetical protein
MKITHETLYTEIMNIKKDTTEMRDDYKEVCKQVNDNRENIASQKSVIKIMQVFLTGIALSIFGFFWSHK